MILQSQERSLDHIERVLQQSLGRELTAREKFYLALAEAAQCNQERELAEFEVSGWTPT